MKRVYYRIRRFSSEGTNSKDIKIDTSELSKFKSALNRLTGGEELN